MEVVFASRELERCFRVRREAHRAWGPAVGDRFILRIRLIQDAQQFADLFTFRTLRLHPLKGPRKGEYALTVHGRWRLILRLSADQRTVAIREMTLHYGD